MAEKWRIKLAQTITSTPTKYPYEEPFLSKPANNDLSRQWVVEYGIWSERGQKVKRKVLAGQTVEERIADSKAVIAELKKTLKSGVCVDALAKAPVRAEEPDRITPSTPLKKAIDLYLDYKKKTTKYNSYRTYRSSLNTFKKYLADTPGLKNVTLNNFHEGILMVFSTSAFSNTKYRIFPNFNK